MPDDTEQELRDRLQLIETMIAEGRAHTENWGWAFVLWGLVYYAALAWTAWNHSAWAWPVTVIIGVAVTVIVASSKAADHPMTTLARAVGSIWIALGVSMFPLFFALGMSGRLTDGHLFAAVISAMLGLANGASSILLRWKVQLASAIVWWATAVVECFVSNAKSTIVFLVAIFLCQILFGVYGMIVGGQQRKPRVPAHA
ncbi:MAG TPA: hypothetical protein VN727_01585 [Candidatus Binatia bacterium]|nr:hypothetical protein [Candidatus Binatia bacterium]